MTKIVNLYTTLRGTASSSGTFTLPEGIRSLTIKIKEASGRYSYEALTPPVNYYAYMWDYYGEDMDWADDGDNYAVGLSEIDVGPLSEIINQVAALLIQKNDAPPDEERLEDSLSAEDIEYSERQAGTSGRQLDVVVHTTPIHDLAPLSAEEIAELQVGASYPTLDIQLAQTIYVIGHGELIKEFDQTFVPHGTLLKFGAIKGQEIDALVALEILQNASRDQYDSYDSSVPVPNYSFSMHNATEVEDDLSSLNFLNSLAMRVVILGKQGKDDRKLPDKVIVREGETKLCTTPTVCSPRTGHTCTGLLGEFRGCNPEIIFLTCRAVHGDKGPKRTSRAAWSQPGISTSANISAFIEPIYHRWIGNKITATMANQLISPNEATAALAHASEMGWAIQFSAKVAAQTGETPRELLAFLTSTYLKYKKHERSAFWRDPDIRIRMAALGLDRHSRFAAWCRCGNHNGLTRLERGFLSGVTCMACSKSLSRDSEAERYTHLVEKPEWRTICCFHVECPRDLDNSGSSTGNEVGLGDSS